MKDLTNYEFNGWQIIELPIFANVISKLLGNDKVFEDLKKSLIENPEAGISLGAGLRKVRWVRPGMGKRGGVRVIYCYQKEKTLIFLYAFSKNKQENLTKQQLKQFKTIANSVIEYLRKEKKII